jgi:AcrR family transcriptional regulator
MDFKEPMDNPPLVTTTDARMVRTRAAMRKALLALLERKQLDHITVRDIAAEAKIGYATFFRHHESKWELLKDVAEEEISRLMAQGMPLLAAADTRGSALALCKYVREHRAIWSALLTGGAAGAMREEFIRQAIQNGASQVQKSRWLPVELGAIFGVSATVEILAWWLGQPEDFSVERIAEIVDRLVIAPTTGPKKMTGERDASAPRAGQARSRRKKSAARR